MKKLFRQHFGSTSGYSTVQSDFGARPDALFVAEKTNFDGDGDSIAIGDKLSF